jgi:hypothetical protein
MPSGTLMADSQSSLSSNPFNTYFWTPHFPLSWISLAFWPPWKKPVKPLMVIHEWVDFQTAKLRDRERESPLQQSNGLQQSHKLGVGMEIYLHQNSITAHTNNAIYFREIEWLGQFFPMLLKLCFCCQKNSIYPLKSSDSNGAKEHNLSEKKCLVTYM